MAVRTHITEGINLLRSASPNGSITTPPGTTPPLLFAAGRQLIRAKTENEREGKTGERRAERSLWQPSQRQKHRKTCLKTSSAQVTGRRRPDDLSSFLSYQNKSGMIDEYFAPPSFAPSLLQGQFMSGSLLRCEVIKARDSNKAASPWAGEVRGRGESAAARPRLHLYSSPARRRDSSFPPSQRLVFHEAAWRSRA